MKSMIGAATAAVFASVCLSGCGTITQGTSQDITITSNPPGGHCDLNRKGEHVATLDKTPGTVKVDKTKNDILLTCSLAGYQEASVNLESGYGAGTFGNIILGGGIGWAIDSASGADNKYPSTANVQFVPLNAAASSASATQVADTNKSAGGCTHDQQVQAKLAQQNGYTAGPKCD
jgi:hypothetical protein